MSRWGRSEAVGSSGDVWVLWNDGEVDMEFKHVHKFSIHVGVSHRDGRQ